MMLSSRAVDRVCGYRLEPTAKLIAVWTPGEPRKPRKASWRELPPAEMAAHLLATPTIGDGVWTSEPRLPREKRSDFVRRPLGQRQATLPVDGKRRPAQH